MKKITSSVAMGSFVVGSLHVHAGQQDSAIRTLNLLKERIGLYKSTIDIQMVDIEGRKAWIYQTASWENEFDLYVKSNTHVDFDLEFVRINNINYIAVYPKQKELYRNPLVSPFWRDVTPGDYFKNHTRALAVNPYFESYVTSNYLDDGRQGLVLNFAASITREQAEQFANDIFTDEDTHQCELIYNGTSLAIFLSKKPVKTKPVEEQVKEEPIEVAVAQKAEPMFIAVTVVKGIGIGDHDEVHKVNSELNELIAETSSEMEDDEYDDTTHVEIYQRIGTIKLSRDIKADIHSGVVNLSDLVSKDDKIIPVSNIVEQKKEPAPIQAATNGELAGTVSVGIY